ncbi:hypothetical protein OUZ56_028308 [Daphnia magna]|uniref:Uncharacterized protein n=1 Tax=Daphnia magna TaxID=35525 RepID=A0ABR0B3G6_9CRUS|nr:hypothetical protein OUZ56_028308 [Daphnia magna]
MSWRNVTALYKAGHPARINPEHPGNEKEKTGASGRRRTFLADHKELLYSRGECGSDLQHGRNSFEFSEKKHVAGHLST